ncbi:hypothetical protein [Gemmata obscuriglobus]|nr:hypothetical protein [Gemmata obscuriglobus]
MASKTKKLTAFGLVTVALVVGAGLVAGFSPAPAHRPVSAAPVPRAAPPAAFLVQHNGNLMYIAANGKEEEKIDPPAWNGSLSPNGQRLAALEFAADIGRAKLVIRSRREQDESATVPLVFGQPGRSGGHMVWSADGRRTLIVETGFGDKGKREYAHRVYDLITKQLTDVKLPDGCLATGWSADGKRFLGDVRPSDDTVRVAWLSAEGAGKPEYISPDDEIAYGGRLSPNGKRVLYMSGPKPAKDQQAKIRLHVQDLATGKRTPVDEPGETHGYCWSPDGSRVAYTWQRSLEKPSEVPERETQLITADPDGRNRKVVTSRKYEVPENSSGRASVVLFFSVWDWR